MAQWQLDSLTINKKSLIINKFIMAEGEGFEPSTSCPVLVFKTSSINHSVTLPSRIITKNYYFISKFVKIG